MDNLAQVINMYGPMLYLLLAWSFIWKGIALWHSARNKQLGWYIPLLIINTCGILEIIYIAFFRKNKQQLNKNIQ